MKQFLEKHFINVAITVVFITILAAASLSLYNKQQMNEALTNIQRENLVLVRIEQLFQTIGFMDISSRGYALISEDSFFFLSVENARRMNARNFDILDSLLTLQDYNLVSKDYLAVKQGFSTYTDIYEKMYHHLKNGDKESYLDLLSVDYGKTFSQEYGVWLSDLKEFEQTIYVDAQAQYEAAVFLNTLMQIILVIIGLPTLGFVLFKIKQQERNRAALLLNLKQNNEKYLFNDGSIEEKKDVEILENSIKNLQRASDFVNEISEGNYNVKWETIKAENEALNKENLAGRLVLMREQMKKVKLEDSKRLWATEGLSQFSEIIRNNQHDLEELSQNALEYLSKYLSVQQGSLFILEGNENEDNYLRLASCFAFDKKKFIEKRIEVGQGLVGQTYLERKTLILTEIPQAYTLITSGLGDATPSFLVIVPMIYNEKVQALIELASFEKLEPHQVSFLEKAGEFVASAISTAQNSSKTKVLFEQMQAQTEQMRAQEEELRQNMEELEATQEEMRRKEVALEEQLANMQK